MPADGMVSVVMAVHNEPEEILTAAVDSVLTQSLKDMELVICDDGSGPAAARSLRRWERDGRVTLLRSERAMGAAAARNRALRQARGGYIAIMDADDVSEPERLERERAFLEAHPEFAFAGCRGGIFEETPGDRDRYYPYIACPEPADFLMTLPFVHASVMFRREALDAAGGYREIKRVKRSEDYDLLLRLYAMGLRGANLPETLYHCRVNAAARGRRKYRYRFPEAAVKLSGFARLGLMPRGILYALKPLAVGLIPAAALEPLKERYYAGTARRRDGT